MDNRLRELAEAVQSDVFHARVDGMLGSLNDDLCKEKLKPFLRDKLLEYGHPLPEAKLVVIVEYFPIVDVEPDDSLAGVATTSENEAKNIGYLLGWALPDLAMSR